MKKCEALNVYGAACLNHSTSTRRGRFVCWAHAKMIDNEIRPVRFKKNGALERITLAQSVARARRGSIEKAERAAERS